MGTLPYMSKLTGQQAKRLVWGGVTLQIIMGLGGFAIGYFHSTHDKWVLGAVGGFGGMAVFALLVWVVGIPVALRWRRRQDQVT